MTVLVLNNAPPKLRGDITKWMFEVNTGVYIGKVNARVREQLWSRICENIKSGRATMVFQVQGEQGVDFWVHNTIWEPVDFDGLKLMRLPSEKKDGYYAKSFSNASKRKKLSKIINTGNKNGKQNEYCVVDIETTGLVVDEDEIIEIAAVIVRNGEIESEFSQLVKCSEPFHSSIEKLTGITYELLEREGEELNDVLKNFKEFIGNRKLIFHNASFDMSFLRIACQDNNLEVIRNKYEDTLVLAKRKLRGLGSYKLSDVARTLNIEAKDFHRALDDCLVTFQLYEKLNEN